jgi:AAA15 family ATPase/GTPase
MLIEFNVTNFRSFLETQTFSMTANNAIELQTENTFDSGIAGLPRFLHSAVIYGANAAGKSNLLVGLRFMKEFVLYSAKESQNGDKIKVTPFIFHQEKKTQPSEFEVLFIQEGVRYQYGFAVTEERVTDEWLFAYPERRAQRWFERKYDFASQQEKWNFGKLKVRRKIWKETTRSNALFLSTAIQLNSKQLKPVFDWFHKKLRVGKSTEISLNNTFRQGKTDFGRYKILDFLNAADIKIADFQLITRRVSVENLPDDISPNLKKRLVTDVENQKTEIITEVQFFHPVIGGERQEKIALDLQEESDGTQRLFEFAGLCLEVLSNGKILAIDELNNSLHPNIVRFLIDLFHNPDLNKHNAQLIFTTHDTTVLDEEIFRPDQIWFVEKDEENATQLYPLSDMSLRKNEGLQKEYLNGQYGALPDVKMFRRK